jgi:uncharacterized integral membrane protein (TIGR00698 family)
VTTARDSLLPGLLLCVALAAAAEAIHTLPVPPFTVGDGRHPVDAILIAIALGMALRNTLPVPALFGAGIKCSVKRVLPFAIVFLGAKLNFFDIVRVSAQALLISVICVIAALSLTLWLCRRTGVGTKLGLLIGVGTAICGGTAIAVIAPVIEAEDEDMAFAVTAITLYGLVSIAVFPLLGAAMAMSQLQFGIWAGVGIHATPQVMAAGFAYGSEAGDIAVIVKLVRVLLLAPMVVGVGAWYARSVRRHRAHVPRRTDWRALFPPFILGFVTLALANTLHLLPDFTVHLRPSVLWPAQDVPVAMAGLATRGSAFLITVAMAGVGLGVNVRGLVRVGLKALYVGAFATVVLAGFSLALLQILL